MTTRTWNLAFAEANIIACAVFVGALIRPAWGFAVWFGLQAIMYAIFAARAA